LWARTCRRRRGRPRTCRDAGSALRQVAPQALPSAGRDANKGGIVVRSRGPFAVDQSTCGWMLDGTSTGLHLPICRPKQPRGRTWPYGRAVGHTARERTYRTVERSTPGWCFKRTRHMVAGLPRSERPRHGEKGADSRIEAPLKPRYQCATVRTYAIPIYGLPIVPRRCSSRQFPGGVSLLRCPRTPSPSAQAPSAKHSRTLQAESRRFAARR